MDAIVVRKGTPSSLSLQPLSISGGDPANHHQHHDVSDVSINSIPAVLLGRALDYLPLSDVLTTRLVQKDLGQEAIGEVRLLNIMDPWQLDPRIARRFPSVKSINALCILTDFEFRYTGQLGFSSPFEAKFIVNEKAIWLVTTFLKQFKDLDSVFLGGYYDGSKRAYEASCCRGPTNLMGLCETLFRNLVSAFDDDESPLSNNLCLEGVTGAPFCTKGPNRSGEPCQLCSLVAKTFPYPFVRELLFKSTGSNDGKQCLSMLNILRCIESRPNDGGVDSARAQIPLILEQLISDGPMLCCRVSSTRTRSSCAITTNFIDQMAREGSGNDGREQAIFSLKDSARIVLTDLLEYDPAATRLKAIRGIMESMRSSVSGAGKLVIRDKDLDFLADEEGFGLDQNDFIALDAGTFDGMIMISDQERCNRADRPADLPTHIQFGPVTSSTMMIEDGLE